MDELVDCTPNFLKSDNVEINYHFRWSLTCAHMKRDAFFKTFYGVEYLTSN